MEQKVVKDKPKKLAVFDIDGTITFEGKDSWFEATSKMVTDHSVFEAYLKVWKENKKNDPYGASLKMMKQAVNLFPKTTNSMQLYNVGREIFSEIIGSGQIRSKALKAIQTHYLNGFQVVFSTTSYAEVGQSLVDNFLKKGLLDEEICQSIIVSGTNVNWITRTVEHFNMSDGKLEGIAKLLDLQVEEVKSNIQYAYGDDPLGNDSGILKYAKSGFVIHTLKNSQLETTHLGRTLEW